MQGENTWSVGILIFNEVEVLDFAGPFEVFSLAAYPENGPKPFRVTLVAQTKEPVRARNGLRVIPDLDFGDAPEFDILIVPGGYGAEEIEIHNQVLLDWLRERAQSVAQLASVCTGALLLAEAGLLNGKKATTHWMDLERLRRDYPEVEVQSNVKYVDEGRIVTAAGISAGINMSFFLVSRLLGDEVARATARRMEYEIG
jgi:transcriptional regulator GlxA family with amidase domain